MAQASSTQALYAYLSGAWTLLDDIYPCTYSYGMSSNRPTDRLADTGTMNFTLNNSAGLYTPGGPSALAGWRKGVPIKMVVTYESEEYVRWRGVVEDIESKPNFRDKRAYVTVVDWLDYAARHPIINPGIDTDKRGDEVLDWVMANVSVPPQQTDFDTGRETFPTVYDTTTSKTKAYAEFAKVAFSELGYIYRRADKTAGETLVFESADARHGWREPGEIPLSTADSNTMIYEDSDVMLYEDGDTMIYNETAAATFGDGASDTTIEDFEAPYGDHVINRMTVTANPRRLDSSPQILFQLDEEVVIASGTTYTLKGTYADPAGGLPVNGMDMITPVQTTDYTMFTATSGGGSNISSDLSISITYGTEGFSATLTNNNINTGYVNKFNTRGTGIYRYNPIQHSATNSESISEFDYSSDSINQVYQNTLDSGRVWVDSVVDEHHEPRVVLSSVSFTANKSPAHMMAFLHTDIGDLRYIEIDELGITGNYYVQGIRVEMSNQLIKVTWIVVVGLALLSGGGLSPLALELAGGVAQDAVDFGVIPYLQDFQQRSWSCWAYRDVGGIGTLFSMYSDDKGVNFYAGSQVFIYSKLFTDPGNWKTTDAIFTTLVWHHIVVTFDIRGGATSDPKFYFDGTEITAITEVATPGGSLKDEAATKLIVGNVKTASIDYLNAWDGKLFDIRIYDRILTASEISTIYNGGTPDESLLTDPSTGLVFQAVNVRTEDLSDYVDNTLTSDMFTRDAVFGVTGTTHGAPVGRAAP